jgi:hypothetical protein
VPPRMCARQSKNKGDLRYEKVKGWPDLESATEKEIAEMNAATVVEVAKQESRDQEPAQHEKKIDAGPSNLCPRTVIRKVVAENQKDCDTTEYVERLISMNWETQSLFLLERP